MTLKRNILSNYVGQIYVTLIGIVMVPLYLKYMGTEAYGLVGFYAMVQAWFQLLDMGLTLTIARETARYSGGTSDALNLRQLLHAFESIFISVALFGCVGIMAGSAAIAGSWLKVQQLSIQEVQHAVMLMAIVVALRWISGLYRGAINGFERLVWLNSFNILIATLHFVFVIPFFVIVGTSPTDFFSYQVIISIIEVVALVIKTYQLLPALEANIRLTWSWQPIRGILKFSSSIAFAGLIWVIVTQADKLILSKLLSLTDYAYFTLAVLVAGGVVIISSPISGALLPRMTKLNAENNVAGMVRLYCNATQIVGMIAIPIAIVFAVFAEQVLWVWTGNAEIARNTAPVLALYSIGYGFLALCAFPYYLQYAIGDLKLHLIGSVLFIVLLIPVLIVATGTYGVIGAGYAWLWANAVYFLFWVPWVHKKIVPGLHSRWLRDVLTIFVFGLVGLAISYVVVDGGGAMPQSRLSMALRIVAVSTILFTTAAMGSSWVRDKIAVLWRMR
jgi:O-antigen/teichoic acid export membrane protein